MNFFLTGRDSINLNLVKLIRTEDYTRVGDHTYAYFTLPSDGRSWDDCERVLVNRRDAPALVDLLHPPVDGYEMLEDQLWEKTTVKRTLFETGDRVKYVGTDEEQLAPYEGKFGTVISHELEKPTISRVLVIFDVDAEWGHGWWVEAQTLTPVP